MRALVGSLAAKTLLTYFTIVMIVFLGAYIFSQESILSEVIPKLLSIVLLIPLYVWHRKYASKEELSKEIDERKKTSIVSRALTLFLLALAVRIPSVLLFDMPLEKTPLIYLLILTIVIIEKTDISAFGFKSQNIGTSLVKGAVFFLIFGGSMWAIQGLLIFAFTGEMVVASFDILAFLFAMPFHTLCVGISEEGLFRGYMQNHLEKCYTFRKAILIQAFAFGVWHFVWDLSPFNSLDMFVYIASTFFWGLIVGYYYGKSRTLIPTILTHGLWNSVIMGMLMNETVLDALEKTPLLNQVSAAALPYVVSAVLTFAFIKFFVKEG